MNIGSSETKTSFLQNTKSTFSSRFRNRLRKKKSAEESSDTGDVSLEDVHETAEVSKEMSATKRKKQYERFNRIEEFFLYMVTSSFGVSCAEFDCCHKIADIQDEHSTNDNSDLSSDSKYTETDQGFIRACKIFRYIVLEFLIILLRLCIQTVFLMCFEQDFTRF